MEPLTIGRLAELTGIEPGTLRAWERRYGVPRPQRTATGQRLYGEEELALVRQLKALIASGLPAGRAVEQLQRADAASARRRHPEEPRWQEWRARLLKAVDAFDIGALEEAHAVLLSLFPVDVVAHELFLPVLRGLGAEWADRADGIAREHFMSAFLRNKLGARFHHDAGRGRGPLVITACLPGEQHELGLMLFALAICARGLRALYLGQSLPLAQLRAVVQSTQASAVVVSGTWVAPEGALRAELVALAAELHCPVYVGGSFSERWPAEEEGVRRLGCDIPAAALRLSREMVEPARDRVGSAQSSY